MAIYTYLLKSEKDESFYCGITENLEQRLNQHNTGQVISTKTKSPWKLVYFKEHEDYPSARKHEIWLKKKNKKYKLQLIKK